MPLISGSHNRRQIFFNVAIVGISIEATHYATGQLPSIGILSEPVRALVDTGATATSISPGAASRLNLRPAGRRDVMTANGVRRSRSYEFQIAILSAEDASGSEPAPFYVLPQGVHGNELMADAFTFDILLGMDVISQGDLTIRRDGTFSFEF
ncbi:MAG: retropepsin-like aspartic protease [Pseudomonadota bacterium]